MANINDNYFDGHYKDIWKAIIPAELTVKETAFMLSYFGLTENSTVLDMMCGYGRHAIALGEKGIGVTAVDNLGDYVAEINKIAAERSLPVKTYQADAANFTIATVFDLVICMGNSLNFFSPQETQDILNNIATQLKSGGHLLINSWSIAEIAIPRFKEKGSTEIGGITFLTDSILLHDPTRIETTSTILAPDGSQEVKKAVDYIFSVAELERMMSIAGLSLTEVYSIPGKKKFAPGEPRAYIIATKP